MAQNLYHFSRALAIDRHSFTTRYVHIFFVQHLVELCRTSAEGSLIKLNCLINWNVLVQRSGLHVIGTLQMNSPRAVMLAREQHSVSIRIKESVHNFELHSIPAIKLPNKLEQKYEAMYPGGMY